MPYFDFNAPAKRTKGAIKARKANLWTTQEKNVKGVVDITKDLEYIVIVRNEEDLTVKEYDIHKDCYKCKAHRTIYSPILWGEHKQRLIIERIPDDCKNHYPYLPFCVGAVVIGNIVFRNDTFQTYFKIKKCYIDNEDTLAVQITKAFKAIYNKDLEQQIINNYFNE